MSAASVFLRFLDECERENIPAPKGTKHITVDGHSAVLLSVELDVPPDVAFDVLRGVPVKEARQMVRWFRLRPEEERIRAMRAWRRNWDEARDERRAG